MGIATLILLLLCHHNAIKKAHSFQQLHHASDARLPSSWRWKRPHVVSFDSTLAIATNYRIHRRWVLAAESEELVEKSFSNEESASAVGIASPTKSQDAMPEKTIDNDVSAITSSPVVESLANKYYQRKMNLMVEEANTMTDSSVEETKASTADVPTSPPQPPTTVQPRRRFTDFGIASERAEPIGGEVSTQESESSARSSEDSSTTMTMKLRGFSESGRPQPWIRSDNAYLEEEMPPAAAVVTKEQKPASSSEVMPQQSSKLINTQPSSPPSNLSVPKTSGVDIDVSGQPLIIFGVAFSLALGIYLRKVSDVRSNGSVDNKESVFFGNITNESKNLLQKVKDAGTAGAISYALWEAAFWGVSVPICLVSYRQVMGRWPDLTSGEDLKKLGLEAFAFVNFARLAVPIRIGLALSTVPWVTESILPIFMGSKETNELDGEIMTSASENLTSTQVFSGDDEEEETPFLNDAADNLRVSEATLSSAYYDTNKVYDDESLDISEVENRLRRIETEALRISTLTTDRMSSAIDSTPRRQMNYHPGSFSNINEYCEPGQVNNACSESIQGYLDSLASTGAIATDGEVKTIVGYLDSLSSNIVPNNINRGAAFTSYLDALSMGSIPAPTSAKAVANYLDMLSNDTLTPTASSQEVGGQIGSRINDVEERLSRLESSIVSLPDEIASRLVSLQADQDKKMNNDMEKIMKILVDEKENDN